ncbi:unnamed protein product, partial [Mesorhabditis belari]|uniref:Fungal lipase-type domain-containing protein n=1 Tax=Mesorhabditis belari TaxID=2138241 RepID=A0AAF3F1F7_9BILA
MLAHNLPFFLIFGLIGGCLSDCGYSNCESCAAATDGCGWCLVDAKCSKEADCKSEIFLQNDSYNCPRSPNANFPFDDTFGRKMALPLYWRQRDFCYSYTAFDLSRKAIMIAFRGTSGNFETVAEILGMLKKKDNFLNIGLIYDYFFNGFFFLWRAGLEAQVMTLRKVYPTYDVYIVGYSLGGSLASLCAAYLVKQGLFEPEKIKIMTFGQPRTGDVRYAEWHDANIPFSYRVVHHLDPIPHIPPQEVDLMHHRFEIWYDNAMTTANYTICPYGDLIGQCANSKIMWQFDDHTHYYNTAVSDWWKTDCK